MKFITLSDTHGTHQELTQEILELAKANPQIQTIIHAGDGTSYRDLSYNEVEFRRFLKWYQELPFPNKIYIPGNHDTSLEPSGIRQDLLEGTDVKVLFHESMECQGFTIFGSPYTPAFFDWAFNVPRESIKNYWQDLKEGIDVLVTHGPVWGFGDKTRFGTPNGEVGNFGDKHLMEAVERIEPKVHIFGHFHDHDGIKNNGIYYKEGCKTQFINASIVDNRHKRVNSVKIVEIS